MEFSWLTRLKITAVLTLGIVVWGVYMWPFVASDDPLGAVTLAVCTIPATGLLTMALAAFATGFFAYFLAWPYGREIGILAVPAGLAALAVRSGNMSELMQTHGAVAERMNLYRTMSWEGCVWFALAAIGYAGTQCAALLMPSSGVLVEFEPHKTKPRMHMFSAVALVAAIAIAVLMISLFAKDVSFPDKNFGSVLGQPANRTIAFASMLAFGLAAFIVKRFWDASYVWPAIATVIVTCGSMILAGRADVLNYMAANWPAAFFAKSAYAALPIQTVAFGIIGSITGYWLAVRFNYWRQYQSK